MQRQRSKTVTLDDILITKELSQRSPRPPNWQAEAQAMQPLARQMARDLESLLQTLVEIALELCQAGTAGVSLLETSDGEEVFRWSELAGRFTHDGLIPRDFSPCGVCVDRSTPQLFSHPERYFTYLHDANTPIVEALLLPLIADDHAIGAIWIMSHDEQRHFDAEDVRVMTSLADFTAAALLLKQQQTRELLAVNAALEAKVEEHRQAEDRARALISNLPGGAAFVVDRDLRYLLAEGEALSAAGFKPKDFIGRTIFEVLPPELTANYEVLYRKALAGESFEYEHSAHDRSYISRGTPLRSPNGEVYAVLAVSYDISDRKIAEAAIAADLKDTQLLHDLSARLTTEDDIQAIYQEIVATAIALTRADAGTVQILDEATQDLLLLATQGFERDMTDHFYHVNASSNTPCGIALRNGDRTFVDFDVPQSEDPDGSLQMHVDAGYLSAQSTPLIARSGKAIGMVSTHWRKHHQPSDRDELRFLDLLARQAADLIEQRQAQAALRESEARLALELADAKQLQFISSQLLQEENINVLYEQILEAAIAIMRSEMGSMQMLHPDSNQLQLLAWKGFDPASAAFWEWVQVDSETPCGMALNTGERAIIPDVETWESLTGSRDLDAFRLSGIRSVQTTPLISRSSRLVGMISNHWRAPHQPSERELGLLDVLARQAADLIEQRQAEATLRQSEAKYRSLFTSIDEGYALCEVMYDENERPVDVRYLEVNPAFEQLTGLENAVGKTAVELNLMIESFWLETIDQVVQTGVATRLENYAEGLNRWLDVYLSRVGGEGSRQIAIVFNDITDRKRTEAQLRRAAELDAFRLMLSDALRSLSDPVQIQAEACRLLGEQLGIDRAYYVEVNEAGGYSRINQDYVRGDSPSLVGTFSLAEYGWSVPYLRRGETITVADTQTDTIVPNGDRELMAAIGIISHISLPLIKAGELVGALCVTEAVPREWSTAEVELVRETAERIWASIERARAEESLRESEIQRVREQSAREQERQRAENLAELDRAKTLFFSNVSHEFRTPLTLLLAPLQDALSDRANPLAPLQQERLELAHRNANRLLKLVNTLLDFSRIEAGRMEAVYEPTDLAMFTTELASVFRSAIERAGLRLIVDCPPLPEPVYVDREMWEKTVLNLLSNALKFTLEGEIAVRLHRADGECAQRNGRAERVRLQIQDTGTGIAPEELPHLFERFYQVRGAQARTHEGSGIGLALVHELIRLHGGTVDVSSVVGQGTCFTVTIPLGTAHLQGDRLRLVVGDSPSETLRERNTTPRTQASTAIGAASYVEEAERWLPEAGSRDELGAGTSWEELSKRSHLDPPQPPEDREENIVKVPLVKGDLGGSLGLQTDTTFPSARILLVDDNADMRDYLTRILSEYAQVEAVADGATALAAVQERAPNLVLSDVMMPGLDGFALLKALRADPQTREIPIILLSARAGEESIVEGLEAGADDYLIKPFSAAELVSRVNAHLQMAQLRGEALRQERTTSRRKDELLSTVSHELNTPLVAILGWTRLLRGSPLSQSMLMKSLETIERNATLQAKLIQDLLDISRITAGKVRLSLQPVELQSVIENAIAAVLTAAIAKDIHLQWQPTDRNPSVTVLGDRDRLQQTICNLLTNAIKFTPESGSITVQLVVKESWESKVAEIGITDTGIGIATDFLPHVFDRFRQAEGADSAKGLGLGLAIARHLVELHNGTIHAESSGAGLGATFTVKLPILQE